MPKQVRVKCGHCHGCGTLELTGVYRETFEMIGAREEVTGASLAKLIGSKPTAVNNQLATLEKHGLLVSRRYGRQRLYRKVSNA